MLFSFLSILLVIHPSFFFLKEQADSTYLIIPLHVIILRNQNSNFVFGCYRAMPAWFKIKGLKPSQGRMIKRTKLYSLKIDKTYFSDRVKVSLRLANAETERQTEINKLIVSPLCPFKYRFTPGYFLQYLCSAYFLRETTKLYDILSVWDDIVSPISAPVQMGTSTLALKWLHTIQASLNQEEAVVKSVTEVCRTKKAPSPPVAEVRTSVLNCRGWFSSNIGHVLYS